MRLSQSYKIKNEILRYMTSRRHFDQHKLGVRPKWIFDDLKHLVQRNDLFRIMNQLRDEGYLNDLYDGVNDKKDQRSGRYLITHKGIEFISAGGYKQNTFVNVLMNPWTIGLFCAFVGALIGITFGK